MSISQIKIAQESKASEIQQLYNQPVFAFWPASLLPNFLFDKTVVSLALCSLAMYMKAWLVY